MADIDIDIDIRICAVFQCIVSMHWCLATEAYISTQARDAFIHFITLAVTAISFHSKPGTITLVAPFVHTLRQTSFPHSVMPWLVPATIEVGPADDEVMRCVRAGQPGRSVNAVTRPTKMAAIDALAHLYFIIIALLLPSISRAAAFDSRRRISITVFAAHHVNSSFVYNYSHIP